MRIDKDNIKIILILLVVCLSLGYAYINSDLNINGTVNSGDGSYNCSVDTYGTPYFACRANYDG